MKKVGIVADNYKLEKFKEKLLEKGFTDFTVMPFTLDTSQISVDNVPEHKVGQIATICKYVESHFKESN